MSSARASPPKTAAEQAAAKALAAKTPTAPVKILREHVAFEGELKKRSHINDGVRVARAFGQETRTLPLTRDGRAAAAAACTRGGAGEVKMGHERGRVGG